MITEDIKNKLIVGMKGIYPDIKESIVLFIFCPYRVCPIWCSYRLPKK